MKSNNILATISIIAGVAVIYNCVQKGKKNPPVYFIKNLKKNYNARTIPPFGIYIKDTEKDNKALLEHELVHWKQYQDKGLINYYRDYYKEMKQYGYDNMPMEKEARKNETEYCQNNYTECVKNGTSKTVHNPNFRT